jgi:hypothetical protein
MTKLLVRCVFFPFFVFAWLLMMGMALGVATAEWLWERAELE